MSSFPVSLFADILRGAPFQPATDFWRAIELTVLIERGLPEVAGARAILDLGCGDGEIMRLLRSHLPKSATLTGIDIDPAETALAEATGLYAHILCSGAERMALPDASQDAVISNSVLEHIGPLEAVLAESGRVLKQGGVFVATVPGPDFPSCLSGPWMPGVSREAYLQAMDRRLAHERYWTEAQWRSALDQAGIELTTALPYLSRPAVRRWELLSRLTGGLLYTLTGGARRPIFLQRMLGLRRGKEKRGRPLLSLIPFASFSSRLRRDDGLGEEGGSLKNGKSEKTLSAKVASFMARFLSAGIDGAAVSAENAAQPCGCLLLIGRRR